MNPWILILTNCVLVSTYCSPIFSVNRPGDDLSSFKVERFERFLLSISVNASMEAVLSIYDGERGEATQKTLEAKGVAHFGTTYLDFSVWGNQMVVLDATNDNPAVFHYTLRPSLVGLEVFKTAVISLLSSNDGQINVGSKIQNSPTEQLVFLERINKNNGEILDFTYISIENEQISQLDTDNRCSKKDSINRQIAFNKRFFVSCLVKSVNEYKLTVGASFGSQIKYQTLLDFYKNNSPYVLFSNPFTDEIELQVIDGESIVIYSLDPTNLSEPPFQAKQVILEMKTEDLELLVPIPKLKGIELHYKCEVRRIFYLSLANSTEGCVEINTAVTDSNDTIMIDQIKFRDVKRNLTVKKEQNSYSVFLDSNYCLKNNNCTGSSDPFNCDSNQTFFRDKCYQVLNNHILTAEVTAVADCPAISTVEGDLKECGNICLNGEYYSDNGQCVSNCSSYPGYYSIENVCLNECNQNFTYDSLLCHSSCIYVETGTNCGVTCPAGSLKVPRTSNCVSDCPFAKIKGYCIEECAGGIFNTTSLKCEAECADFIEDELCVSVCAENKVIVFKQDSKYCQNECDLDQEREQKCLLQCGEGLFGDIGTMECQENCTEVGKLNNKSNSTCVSTCGSLFRHMDDCVADCTPTGSIYKYNGDCIDACPLGMIFNENNECSSCSSGFIHSNNCVEQCPQGFEPGSHNICQACSLTQDGICVHNCSQGRENQGGQCKLCGEVGKVNQYGQCIVACNTGYEPNLSSVCERCGLTQDGECVSECAVGRENQGGQCRLCIHIGKVDQDGVCQQNCNAGYEPNSSRICQACSLTQDGICVHSCSSGRENSDGQCKLCGEVGKVNQYSHCVDSCNTGYEPDSSSICQRCGLTQDGECVSQCSSGRENQGGQCRLCLHIGKVDQDGVCQQNCNAGFQPNSSRICQACSLTQDGICVHSCSSGRENQAGQCKLCSEVDKLDQDGVCQSTCNSGFEPDSSSICERCGLTQDGECVSQCSSGRENQGGQCRLCLHIGKVDQDGVCQLNCNAGFEPNSSRMCEECPLQENNNCVSQCSSGRENQGGQCKLCSEVDKLDQDGVCQSTCNSGFEPDSNSKCQRCNLTQDGECVSQCSLGRGNEAGECRICSEINKIAQEGECVTNCEPNRGVNKQNECVLCSESSKLGFNNTCVSFCPSGFGRETDYCLECISVSKVSKEGYCVTECGSGFILGDQNSCVTCEKAGKFQQNGECVAECADGFGLKDLLCLDCKEIGEVNQSKVCKTNCDSGFSPDSNKFCKECSELSFLLEGDSCVSSCSHIKGEFNGSCIDCSTEGLKLEEGKCISACSSGRIENNLNICVTCIDDGKLDQEGSCVNECSEGFEADEGFCKTCSEIGKYYFNGNCVSKCPLNTSINAENKCIHCAELGQVSQNGKCKTACDSLYLPDTNRICQTCAIFLKFEEDGKCVDSCLFGSAPIDNKCQVCSRINKYYYNDDCLDECPSKTESISGGICKRCSEIGKYEFQTKCQFNCPQNYVSNAENVCITCKSIGMQYFEGNCVSECPSHTKEVDSVCSDCLSNSGVMEEGKCLVNCSKGKTINLRKECVPCKEAGLNDYNGDCVSACPDNHVSSDSVCFPCERSAPFYFNSSCVRTCPTNYSPDSSGLCKTCHELGKVNSNGRCLIECPIGEGPNSEGYCLKCTQIGMKLYEGKCFSECPPKTINNNEECNKCKEMFLFEFGSKCVLSCPAGYEPFETECITCKQANKVEYSGKCYLNCPSRTVVNKTNTCVPCSYTGMKLLNDTCISACPDGYRATNGICTPIKPDCSDSSCLPKCEDGFSRGKDGNCYSCSQLNMVVENDMCVNKCSDDKFLVNNHCVSCKTPTFYFEGNCVEDCGYNKIIGEGANICLKCSHSSFFHNDNCVSSCPEGTVADYENNTCTAASVCKCKNGICKQNKCVCSKGFVGEFCELSIEQANLDEMIDRVFSPFTISKSTFDMTKVVEILNLTENTLNSSQIANFELLLG